jgi:hypothetical protein
MRDLRDLVKSATNFSNVAFLFRRAWWEGGAGPQADALVLHGPSPPHRPQENVRLEVAHKYLDQHIRVIKEYVPLVPTELLLNSDESGFSDWEERKPKCVLIPTEA